MPLAVGPAMSATAFPGDPEVLIARLIADLATLERRLDAATAALDAAGLPIAEAVMLDHWGEVLQLMLPGDDIVTLRRVIDECFAPSDAVITTEPFRIPDVFVSDMDSTMIGQECIDELADYAGIKPQIAAITERAMQGELDFPGALRERVRLLAGLDERALSRCLNERVEVTAGAETLVQTMRAGGSSCLLVSGGFLSFAEPIASAVGFDRVKANRLVFTGGKLSGEVGDPIVDAMAKRDALIAAREQLGLKKEHVLAVGDGANDKLMIEEAGLGIAFRAKPTLVEAADAELRYHGLDALLWVQGVRRRDWFRG